MLHRKRHPNGVGILELVNNYRMLFADPAPYLHDIIWPIPALQLWMRGRIRQLCVFNSNRHVTLKPQHNQKGGDFDDSMFTTR